MTFGQDDKNALYRALSSRDARFDGRLFVAVKSTGIYCRPICRARRPKIENCTFYALAAQAEKNGYRPCLICRPELAPYSTTGNETRDPTVTLSSRAVRRIEDGALNTKTVEALAAEFKVTGRYLRKALQTTLGLSPLDLARTCRLLQAKQLLTETTLSITDIAYNSGFSSLRQFNHVFKTAYKMSPRDFKKKLPPTESKRICSQQLRIDYRPPLNWSCLVKFLTARAIPGVEYITDNYYARTVRIGEHSGKICVRPSCDANANALTLSVSDSLMPVAASIAAKVKGVFDVRANVADIETHLRADPLLNAVIGRNSGMRLPGAFDGFELLLRAILGQQISVKAATTLAGRFAARFGQAVDTGVEQLFVSTPNPEAIAEASVADIRALGVPEKRAQTIKLAATAVAERDLILVPGSDPDAAMQSLVTIPGIGEWTADYVAMRALAWPDAFPSGDLGVKKALRLTNRKEILARAREWQPWRAYATLYLWLSLST